MKNCSLCKTEVKDDANFCMFCGSKIQSLSELIKEKQNEMFSIDKKDLDDNEKFYNESLAFEVERIKRNSLILISVFMVLIISLIFSLFFNWNDSKNKINASENIIQSEPIEKLYEYTYEFEIFEDDLKKQEYFNLFNDVSKKIPINREMFMQMYNAMSSLDIDKYKVFPFSLKRDLDGNNVYKFFYGGQEFNAVFDNENKLLNVKNSLGENVFENGQVVKNLNEFLVGYDEMLEVGRISKMIVNLIHKNPTISKFPDIKNEQQSWNMTLNENVITVNSHVDSRNKVGIKIRDKFTVVLQKNENGYKLLDLIFNGEKSNKLIY